MHSNTFDRNKAAAQLLAQSTAASDKVHIVSTSNSSNSPTGSSTNSNPNATNIHTQQQQHHGGGPYHSLYNPHTRNSSISQRQKNLIQTQNSKYSNIHHRTHNHSNPLNSTNTSSATTSLDANSNSNNSHPSEGYHSNNNAQSTNNPAATVTNQLWPGGMPQSAINTHMIETPLDMRKPMALSTFRTDDTSEETDEEDPAEGENQHFLNTNDHYNPPQNTQNIQIQGLEPQTSAFHHQMSPNYQQTGMNSTSTFQQPHLPPPSHEIMNDNFESTFSDSQQNSPNTQTGLQTRQIPYNRYQNNSMHQSPPTLVHNSKNQQQQQFSHTFEQKPSPQHYNTALSPANVPNVGNMSKLEQNNKKTNQVKTSQERKNNNQCCNIIFTAMASLNINPENIT